MQPYQPLKAIIWLIFTVFTVYHARAQDSVYRAMGMIIDPGPMVDEVDQKFYNVWQGLGSGAIVNNNPTVFPSHYSKFQLQVLDSSLNFRPGAGFEYTWGYYGPMPCATSTYYPAWNDALMTTDSNMYLAGTGRTFGLAGTTPAHEIVLERHRKTIPFPCFSGPPHTRAIICAGPSGALDVDVMPDKGAVVSAMDNGTPSLIRFDTLLNITWSYHLAGGEHYIATDPSGNIYLAGGKVTCLNSSAGVIWSNDYSGVDAARVFRLAGGDLVVVGHTLTSGAGGRDIVVMKLSFSGSVIWSNTYGTANNDTMQKCTPLKNGGVAIQANDSIVLRIKGNGDLDWSINYQTGILEMEEPVGLAEVENGGIFAGWKAVYWEIISPFPPPGMNNFGGYFIKTDSTGFTNCGMPLAGFVRMPAAVTAAPATFTVTPVSYTPYSPMLFSQLPSSRYTLTPICDSLCTDFSAVDVSVSDSTCVTSAVTVSMVGSPAPPFFHWFNGTSLLPDSTTSFTRTFTGGTRTVILAMSDGICSDSASVTFTVTTVVNLGPDDTICAPSTRTLTAPAGMASYLWSTGATTASIVVSTSGTYSVTVTNTAGCVSSDSIAMTVITPSSISLGPDTTVCPGTPVTLSGPPGFLSYAWSTGSTAASITTTASGAFSLTITHASGCTSADTVSIFAYSPPAPGLPPASGFCPGDSVLLEASPGLPAYAWSTGSSSSSIYVSAAGMYYLTVTDTTGCIFSDSVDVEAYPSPVFSLGPDTGFCAGSSLMLMGPAGMFSYLWSTGTTTADEWFSTGGTFSLTVTDSSGCTYSDTVSIALYAIPAPYLGADTSILIGTTITLTPGTFVSYSWSTGDITPSITISSGTVSVTVTDTNGCMASDTITVYAVPAPASSFTWTGGPLTYSFTSTSVGATWFLWDFGDGTTSAVEHPVHTFPSFGAYTVCLIVGSPLSTDTSCTVMLLVSSASVNVQNEIPKVYPNPVQTELFVELPEGLHEGQMNLYDVHGRMIATYTLTSHITSVPFGTYPAGSYFTEVECGSGKWKSAVIKLP